jgi:acyl-CoA thioesterase-1
MRHLIPLVAVLLLLPCLSPAQKKVIAVIGSSTASGQGASSYGKAWVGLLEKYYQDLKVIDRIDNYAVSGLTTFDGLPTSEFPNTNVIQALSVHPDVVLVAFPTNDFVKGFTMQQYMSNLHTIYNLVVAAGKKCYITGTQPRDDVHDPSIRQLFKDGRDSITLEFPDNSIDFWDLLADPVTLGFNPLYVSADGIHPNDAGHELLFEAVKAKDILGLMPLPLSFISFTATLNGQSALLRWTAADESGSGYFTIQRSGDGISFDNLEQVKETGKGQQTDYSWTDPAPLAGKTFYRLKITENGNEQYSKIVSLLRQEKGLNILKLYKPDGSPELLAEISIDHDQPLTITITNALGTRVRQTFCPGIAPSLKIPIPLTGLAAGQYFLTVRTAGNDQVTRSFLNL